MLRPELEDYDASKRPVSAPMAIPGAAEETQEFTPSNLPISLSNEQALAKAKAAGFRTYRILNHPSSTLVVIKKGCTGENGEAQKKVAELENEVIAKRKRLDPNFEVAYQDLLGDNIYPSGAKSPDDPEFKSRIHDIYPKNRRGRALLGNHDRQEEVVTEYANKTLNFVNVVTTSLSSSFQISKYPTGLDAGINQIAHTYLQEDSGYFDGNTLEFAKFPPWAMPGQATSYINRQVEEYFLDSNSYALDWLNYMEQWSTNPEFNQAEMEKNNQSAWCEATYRASQKAGRFVIFNQHHPMPNTLSKRYVNYDSPSYLKTSLNAQRLLRILDLDPNAVDYKDQVAAVFKGTDPKVADMPTTFNYNKALWDIVHVRQKMHPRIIFSAHDHAEYVYINQPENPQEKVAQVVIGGGGSHDLHPRFNFANHVNVGTYMKKHGFCLLTIPDMDNPRLEDIKLELFNLDGEHLVFHADSPIPKRTAHADPRVESFRKLVLKACNTYQDSLQASSSQLSLGLFNLNGIRRKFKMKTDLDVSIDCLHDVINFLNRPELPGFDETLQRVIMLFIKHHAKHWSSSPLAMMIDNQLKNNSAEAKELGGISFIDCGNKFTPTPI